MSDLKMGFHGDKHLIEVMKSCVDRSSSFFETGTAEGRSLKYIANKFSDTRKNFFSCEVDSDTCRAAKEYCSDLENVDVLEMKSERLLSTTALTPRSTFWLDAHWPDSTASEEDANEPLKTEIEIITRSLDNAFIFADDVKVPKHDFGYDGFGGKDCSHANFADSIQWDDYTVFYPDYDPDTFSEAYHPPRGWCLITRETDWVKDKFSDVLQWRTMWGQRGLDVATTATVRPKILDRTFSSLNNVLTDTDLEKNGTLYINVDPVPEDSDQAIQEVLDVASSYFADMHYNIGPAGGSFSKAAQWALTQSQSDYFFHCEDDWEFTGGEISVQNYVSALEEGGRENMLQCVTQRKGGGNRIHFPPSLYNGRLIRQILNEYPIPNGTDPERWLINLKRKGKVSYNVTSLGNVNRRDIGKRWAKKRNIQKDVNRAKTGSFDQWDLSNYEPKQ